jgi:ferredoxin-NADP reductase
MRLRIRSITYLTEAIHAYELVDPRGRDLPRFTAGAHVAVRIGGGPVRDYSLWTDPAERRHYGIAVLRERAGLGSNLWHDTVRVGHFAEVSLPRNHFPLAEDAARHLLIAGGIGITPVMAMIAELRRRQADFRVHYCTRAPAETAFYDELALLAAQGRVVFHHDGGDPANGLDIAALLAGYTPGTHLYYCGPPGLMRAAAAAAASHWPEGSVHREYFVGPDAAAPLPFGEDRPFRVRLARSGGEYEVPVGQSIVTVLRNHGVKVTTSCELGYCNTCLTRFVGGEPDHRDQILNEAARRDYLLICCSRAKSDVLDLEL